VRGKVGEDYEDSTHLRTMLLDSAATLREEMLMREDSIVRLK